MFWKFVYENGICTLNAILRGEGYVKWHIPIPYSTHFNIYFTPINGGGAFVPLSYASDSGAAKICQRGGGLMRGSEATDRGCLPPPTVGRFWKCVYEKGIFLHI